MALDPPRRSYSQEKRKEGLRDVDAVARAQKLHAWGWSLYAGVPLGLGLGLLFGHLLLGLFLGPFLVFGIVWGIAAVSGRGASVLYLPSGSTTPKAREYSRARALEIRGEYEAAVRAYESELVDRPEIGEPYLRIARLFRDELKDHESAVRWFRRAQKEARLLPGEVIRSHRELAEIFLYIEKEPRKAAPYLARLAEEFPSTQDGQWAGRELAEIKEGMAAERRGGIPKPRSEGTS